MQVRGLLKLLLSKAQLREHFVFKARSDDPFLRIRFLLVPKIGSCEHNENNFPTHGSVILKKWVQMEHALFSTDTLLER